MVKVGYFTGSNPLDKKSWSGTHYSFYSQLEKNGFKMINLSPVIYGKNYHRILNIYYKIHSLLSNKVIDEEHTILKSFFSKLYFNKAIKGKKVEVIFAPAASTQIALLKTKIPIIYLSDTSFAQIKDYYNNQKNTSWLSLKEADYIEKKALENASKIIYPSNWAKDFTVNYYKIKEDKIVETKLGSNIDIPYSLPEKDFDHEIVFVFLAVEWERKGGDIVFDTIKILREQGYNVKLKVIGCKPPNNENFIEYVGYLDKNIPTQASLLKEILSTSHFLFVPSRAECYGIVFSEASAYGLINISTKTGGIPSVVEDGSNGYLLDECSKSNDYASLISELLNNKNKMKEMSSSSFLFYHQKLNWNNFIEKFSSICNEFVK